MTEYYFDFEAWDSVTHVIGMKLKVQYTFFHGYTLPIKDLSDCDFRIPKE